MKLKKMLKGRSPEASPTSTPVPSPSITLPASPTLVEEKDEGTSSSGGESHVVTPSQYDVLFGRGKPYQGHTGNIRLHKIVDLYKTRYSQARRHQKTEIAEEIVQFVKTGDSKSGRFLKRAEGDDVWVEVSDSVARDKVSHALRGKPRKDECTKPVQDIEQVVAQPKKRLSKTVELAEPLPKKQRLSEISAAANMDMLASQRNNAMLGQHPNASLLLGSLQMDLQAQLMSSIMAEQEHLAGLGGSLTGSHLGFRNLLARNGTQGISPSLFGNPLLQSFRSPHAGNCGLWY